MPYKRYTGSLPGEFSGDDFWKVVRGAAYAGAGAALAWIINYSSSEDLNPNLAIALGAGASIAWNALNKWWANTTGVKV